jgi:hypothetical protein
VRGESEQSLAHMLASLSAARAGSFDDLTRGLNDDLIDAAAARRPVPTFAAAPDGALGRNPHAKVVLAADSKGKLVTTDITDAYLCRGAAGVELPDDWLSGSAGEDDVPFAYRLRGINHKDALVDMTMFEFNAMIQRTKRLLPKQAAAAANRAPARQRLRRGRWRWRRRRRRGVPAAPPAAAAAEETTIRSAAAATAAQAQPRRGAAAANVDLNAGPLFEDDNDVHPSGHLLDEHYAARRTHMLRVKHEYTIPRIWPHP